MPNPQLQIFISGLPGTGKSTLALDLGRRFKLPVFRKDHFKEAMYEAAFPDRDFGAMTIEQQILFGKLSIQNVATAFEAMATARQVGVYEANFSSELFSPILKAIADAHDVWVVQAHLVCKREVLVERFQARERQGTRHPGHQADRDFERVREALLHSADHPLAVTSGELFEFDTTNFSTVNFSPLLERVEKRFANGEVGGSGSGEVSIAEHRPNPTLGTSGT